MRGRMDQLIPTRKGFAAALLAANAVLAACGGDSEKSQPATTAVTSEALPPTASPTTTVVYEATAECNSPPVIPVEGVKFIFDDLGGGSPIIYVYCGSDEKPIDRVKTGQFNNGEDVDVICKDDDGRTVPSDTNVGERPVSSDDWVRVAGTAGIKQLAPMTYGRLDPPDSWDRIPDC